MVDISQALLAKSDQLNAMDLIDPLAIQIDRVDYDHTRGRAQPVWIFYNMQTNPWKPSLGMRKILASKACFGLETDEWVGRRLRILREDSVKFGGKAVGGVEICESDSATKLLKFKVRIARTQNKVIEVKPLVLSDKEQGYFNSIYGVTGTTVKTEIKTEPAKPVFLDAEQIEVIQTLLNAAEWDIADFCNVMKVKAISEIGTVKFDNLKAKLNDKIAKQYQEKKENDGQ